MPLFHGNALMALWGPAVMVGAAIASRPRFSASAFIDDVRRFGATKFSYVGKAIAYILATPERPDDADNTLKSAFGTEASVRDRDRFRKRFGCYLIEGYGQSEGGAAINPVLGHAQGGAGQAGRRRRPGRHEPRDGRGVPASANSTPRGASSTRARPSARSSTAAAGAASRGTTGATDAEQERLRRGWYWTGDLGYVDADGFFYFAGRTGDWLRVDSENFAAGPVEVDHLAPSRRGRGRRLPGPRHRVGRRRPGHGGDRDGAGQGVRPRRIRHLARSSPTWARSGSPATSGSHPHSRRQPRGR